MSNRLITITLNPAVDMASSAVEVVPTHKIQTVGEHIDPGGGGINVSRVIHALGGATLAVILAGGVTGTWLRKLLRERDVPHRILRMAGQTRVSLTIHEQIGEREFRFVPEGPVVTEDELHAALAVLERVDGGWLIASGSLPRGVPHDTYAQIARIAQRRGLPFVLDTSGAALSAALHSGIALLKPSLRELETLVGRKLPDAASRAEEALNLVCCGAAAMVVVTLGPEGALLATQDGVIRMPALAVEVQSSVGAGDAFLASMVLALSRGASPRDALAWGIAAAAAACSALGTARVTLDSVEAQYRRICRTYE